MSEEPTTYQQQAYEYVRDQIINLVLKPGEYVNDTKTAKLLEISRTPVREAFQRLEKEGLLEYEARKGWRVYSMTLGDIHEIFELKIAVEGLLVRKASECKDEELRTELSDALDYMKKIANNGDPEALWKADILLHNTIFMMADNVRAERIINNLNDQWHRLRLGNDAVQGRIEESINEHEAFITSVLAEDADRAEQQMDAHLTRVRDDLIRLVTKVLLPYTDRVF